MLLANIFQSSRLAKVIPKQAKLVLRYLLEEEALSLSTQCKTVAPPFFKRRVDNTS